MSSPEASPSDDPTSPPPPPPTDDSESSPPPPPPSDDSEPSPPPPPQSDNSEPSPPPPPSSGGNSTAASPDRSPPARNNNNNNNNNRNSERGSGGGGGDAARVSSSDNNNNNNNNDKSDSNNNASLIAGVAAAVGLLVLVMVVLMVTCFKRKKKRKDTKYYTDHPPRPNASNNNNNYYKAQNWQNNDVPNWQKDAAGNKMQSAADQNWHMNPSPPMMSSSEMSSIGYPNQLAPPLPPPHPGVTMGHNQNSFTYDDLAAATGGFAQANLLGQGGFGYVHKGVLPNGKEVAVKSLKANSGQGEREFQAEVDIISRVHHRHLVSLVGYCIAGNQRMLVYEFVPNGTLEYHLHGAGCPSMDWSKRLQIALGSAKGFAYLHEDCDPRIIHRDIKAANILLDENFEAKVADFGLAKLSSENITHVSTRIMGTFGYLAPEYASSGKLTEKSDCYSYGIMLLELITGRRPIDMSSDDDGLVDWARPILTRASEGGSYEEMVDPRLGNNYDHHEMLRAVLSAAACIRHSARRRPKMSQIVRALEGEVSLDALDGGVKTAQIAMFGSSGGSELDLKRLGKGAGDSTSNEFTSSEDGNSQEVRGGLRNPQL